MRWFKEKKFEDLKNGDKADKVQYEYYMSGGYRNIKGLRNLSPKQAWEYMNSVIDDRK